MAVKKTPDAPKAADEREPLKDADGNTIDVQEGGVTPPDLDAPTSSAPPASMDPDVVQSAPSPLDGSVQAVEDKTAVTMADVAALNGIGLAPDSSDAQMVALDDESAMFISAGMASDLEQQGWALDPTTGRRVVRKRDDEDE